MSTLRRRSVIQSSIVFVGNRFHVKLRTRAATSWYFPEAKLL